MYLNRNEELREQSLTYVLKLNHPVLHKQWGIVYFKNLDTKRSEISQIYFIAMKDKIDLIVNLQRNEEELKKILDILFGYSFINKSVKHELLSNFTSLQEQFRL